MGSKKYIPTTAPNPVERGYYHPLIPCFMSVGNRGKNITYTQQDENKRKWLWSLLSADKWGN